MAQLKDTTISGGISVSGIANLAGSAQVSGGDLTLYTPSGDSPALVFQRGILTDTYNDWRIRDSGGHLYFDQRGNGSTGWTNVAWMSSSNSSFNAPIVNATTINVTNYYSFIRTIIDAPTNNILTTETLTASRTWRLPDQTGTIALTGDIPSNIVNTITTTAGAHTPITGATGDVSFNVPTKTSDLTNDGDGTSNFARMSDIGSLGGGTITKVKTTAGAHTAIDVSSGDAEFNVPTNTSHLTNDSGFVSSLIGTTSNTTPTQVLTALQAGKTVCITYTDATYGNIVATYFDYSALMNVIISNIIAYYNDGITSQYMLFELIGFLNNNTWQCMITSLAQLTDIPTSATNNTTGISIADHSTTTIYGVSGSTSVYGVKSGTNSTTTASKVTLSGSDSFSATVTDHVLSFSHSAKTVSASDVTVPIRADSATTVPTAASSATTVVTSGTHSITDNGHTHSLS